MRKAIVLILLLTGCAAVKVPPEFVYREIQTRDFTLATWQKLPTPTAFTKSTLKATAMLSTPAAGQQTIRPRAERWCANWLSVILRPTSFICHAPVNM